MDFRISSAQDCASSFERLQRDRTRLSSALVQRGNSSGMSLATASTTMKVVCSRRARRTHSLSVESALSSEIAFSFTSRKILQPAASCQSGTNHIRNNREPRWFSPSSAKALEIHRNLLAHCSFSYCRKTETRAFSVSGMRRLDPRTLATNFRR